ncbi:hypothetical protein LEM8419_00154 [Neolewinella maritima]|uniref:DUF2461 domain-containing protein n=1 Tax=Neolewinella maritima TaxID=1383882 RepID=A0ABN8F4L9_9BACT|nr:DUF2461 domain-containing protein [Neolewinella maritima]CAH0998839.1 hypothetical protein LEM8419_00154 [Neolewinella maritima]
MNKKRRIYHFLGDLAANNSKAWMDTHRDAYQEAKDIWLAEIQAILDRLATHDPTYATIAPKDTILRINNNRKFHPDRPVYKDNFGFSPGSSGEEPMIYVHVSPKHSFIAGGLRNPGPQLLKSLREAIDYDGERLLDILNERSFRDFFGPLSEDPNKLKTSPQGYAADHPHIELLRRKDFTVMRDVSRKEVTSDHFVDLVERAYLELQPFNAYLRQALTV